MAERTYKAKISLTSSSSVKDYNFAFDYINKTYIKVKIGVGTEPIKYGSDYTVVDHTVRLENNPPNEQLLESYRETPTDRTVEWYDSSILRAKDLNLYNIQMLHINEENIDKLLDSGIQEDKLDSKWDGRLKVLKNLADPVENQDAVTKSYLSKTKDSFIQQATVLRDTAKQHADIAVANAKHTDTVKQSVDTTKAAIDVIKSDIDTQHAHIHQDHEHIHQDVATTGSNREAVTAMTADVTAKHTEVLNARNDVVIKSNIATQAANTATQQASIATQQAEEAKHYADIAGEVAGGDILTKTEAIATYLPLEGGTITGDLTVNGLINGTAAKALTADTQENTDNSTKVATTEFVQNVTQEKVSAESNKIHQLVENTFNGLNTGLTETKGNLATLSQYVGNQSTTTWERQKAYAVGDIVYSSKLPPGYYLECTEAGTTDANEPVIPSDLSFGGWLTDGTCTFAVKNTYSKLNIVTPPVEATGSEVVNAEWVNSKIQSKATGTTTYEIVGDWRVMKTPCDNRLFVKLVTKTLPVLLNYRYGEVGFGEGRVTINFPFPLDELMYSIPYISRGGFRDGLESSHIIDISYTSVTVVVRTTSREDVTLNAAVVIGGFIEQEKT